MKRFLSMLALAVLVLQSVVTSAVYAVNEDGEAVPEMTVETVVSDPVSDEGNDNDVVTDLTNSEVTTTEVEETTTVVEPEEKTEEKATEPETPAFEEFDIEPLQLGLNLAPRLFAATEPEQSDFENFVEKWKAAKSCDDVNDEAGCVYNPKQYSLEGVEPGSGLDEGQVGMWKLVQPTANTGEYEISIAVKGQPKHIDTVTYDKACAVVVFDKSNSMTIPSAGGSEGKWNSAVQGAVTFSETLKSKSDQFLIGLVTFGTRAEIGRSLQNSAFVENDFLPQPDGSENRATNLHEGLIKANEMLGNSECDDANKYIVVMSDGEPTMFMYDGELKGEGNSDDSVCVEYNHIYIPLVGDVETTCKKYLKPSEAAINYAKILKSDEYDIEIFSVGYEISGNTSAQNTLKSVSNGGDHFFTGDTSTIVENFSKIADSIDKPAGTDAHVTDNLGDNVKISYGNKEYEFGNITVQGEVHTFKVRIENPSKEGERATNSGVILAYTDVDGNPKTLEINNSASINWVLPSCTNKPNASDGMIFSEIEIFTQTWDENGILTPNTKNWEYTESATPDVCEWTCDTGYEYDATNNTCLKKHVVTVDPNCAEGEEGKDCKVITGDVNHGSKYTLPILEREYTLTYNEHGNITTGDYAAILKGYCEGTPECADEMLKKVGEEVDILSDVTYYAVWDETDLTVKVKKGENYQDAEYIYTFKNWKGSDNNDIEAEDELTLVKDETLVAQYDKESRNATYTVEYYFQNVEGNGYVIDESRTENKAGTTDTEARVDPKEISGFTLNNESSILTGIISADGSLVLKVYYDRVESSIIINPNCKDENEVCDITTKTGSYEKEVPLPEINRRYTLSYIVPEGASGVDSQTVTATVIGYCKGTSDDCDESERISTGFLVKIEAESVTYTAVWSNDMTVTVADGSNYQTDSTVYTFNTWKDGENDVATGSTLTLTSHKELVANYTESCNTGYHYEDTATAKVCVSDYKEVACKQEGAPANAHYNETTGTGTWDGSDYVLNCGWECNPGYRKDGDTCRKNGGGGGGSSSSSYYCKNLPLHAIENNKDKPTKDTDYTYSQNTGAVCTFQCISGYTRNADKKQCIKSGGGNGGGDEVIELGGQVSDKCSVEGSNYSEEEKAAYLYACENDITTIRDIEEARLGDFLTRAEMAKMISVFATKELGMKPNTSKDCSNFADSIASYSQEMKDYMVMSCQLEIMGIHTTNYKAIPDFMPSKYVSRAEFGTVLSRILWGNKYEGTNDNYYVNHLNALKENSIITNIDPTITEYRAWVFLMFYRSVEAMKSVKANTTNETVEEQVNAELQAETGSVVEVKTGSVSEAKTGDAISTTGDASKETAVETGSKVETGNNN